MHCHIVTVYADIFYSSSDVDQHEFVDGESLEEDWLRLRLLLFFVRLFFNLSFGSFLLAKLFCSLMSSSSSDLHSLLLSKTRFRTEVKSSLFEELPLRQLDDSSLKMKNIFILDIYFSNLYFQLCLYLQIINICSFSRVYCDTYLILDFNNFF